MQQNFMGFKGNRQIWLEFTHCVRKQGKEIWPVLEPLLLKYIKEHT